MAGVTNGPPNEPPPDYEYALNHPEDDVKPPEYRVAVNLPSYQQAVLDKGKIRNFFSKHTCTKKIGTIKENNTLICMKEMCQKYFLAKESKL